MRNKIGKHFPIERYMKEKNKPFHQDELKGKMTVINFWSTTCEPCIEELPYLNRLSEIFKDKVNFIAITYDRREKVDQFLPKHSFNYKQITEAAEEMKNYFVQIKIPLTFIVDRKGNIREITGNLDDTKIQTIIEILND